MGEFPHLIVVPGPTGSGKSDLGLSIALHFGGEIVNCDSVQLYRHLDIGTAKTALPDRRGVPHHLIDILDPDQLFTAGDFARLARATISEIAGRGRLPILVGGTGFYIRALLHGLSETPVRDDAIRQRLSRRSPGSLHRILRRLDPATAGRIHPNDTNKLIRAVEVCIQARRPMTEIFQANPIRPLEGFRVNKIGLDPDRDQLTERLNLRCVRMFESGLLQEVEHILNLGYPADARALQSIGYREAVLCLQGQLSQEEALEKTQIATRQYARRQRTWFRREPDVYWMQGFGDDPLIQKMSVHHLEVGIS